MPGIDQNLRNVATRLIDRRGRNVTYQRVLQPVPANPNKPWEVNRADKPDPVSAVVRAVIIPIDHKRIDGSTVLVTDKTCYISAQDLPAAIEIDVRPNDKIIDSFNNRTFNIEDVEDLSPGEQKILYILQLRGND